MTSIISPRPITRAVIRPLSICSQFLRLNGQLGWLTLDQIRWQWEFRTASSIKVFSELDYNSFERTTDEDLKEFAEQNAFLCQDVGAYYDRTTYSGD